MLGSEELIATQIIRIYFLIVTNNLLVLHSNLISGYFNRL